MFYSFNVDVSTHVLKDNEYLFVKSTLGPLQSLKIVFDKVVCKVFNAFYFSHVYEEFNKSLVFKSFSNAI